MQCDCHRIQHIFVTKGKKNNNNVSSKADFIVLKDI